MTNNIDVSSLSNEELIAAYKEAQHMKIVYNTSQQVKKILLNSYYGATGSPYFRYYDKRLAQATTLSGQNLIRKTAKNISSFISTVVNDKTPAENQYIVAGDTDSVASDSIIYVNGKRMTIAEYYDSVNTEFVKQDTVNNNYVKKVYTDYTYSVDNNNVVKTKIHYIMKHRVSKQMYTLKIDNKSVKVTGDHSIIVRRGGKLISCTIMELQSDDKIVFIKS